MATLRTLVDDTDIIVHEGEGIQRLIQLVDSDGVAYADISDAVLSAHVRNSPVVPKTSYNSILDLAPIENDGATAVVEFDIADDDSELVLIRPGVYYWSLFVTLDIVGTEPELMAKGKFYKI